MNESNYYEGVSDLHTKLGALIRVLSEAEKIISPSPKDRETFPGLISTTPKARQLELLQNAWIVLEPINESGGFGSDIDDLIESLDDVGNCPVEPEPEFQGYPVGS